MRFGQVMSMIYQLEMLKWNGFFLWQVSLPLEMIKSELDIQLLYFGLLYMSIELKDLYGPFYLWEFGSVLGDLNNFVSLSFCDDSLPKRLLNQEGVFVVSD